MSLLLLLTDKSFYQVCQLLHFTVVSVPKKKKKKKKQRFFLFGCSHFFILKFDFSVVLHPKSLSRIRRKFDFSSPLLRYVKAANLPTQRKCKRYVKIAKKREVKYLVIVFDKEFYGP